MKRVKWYAAALLAGGLTTAAAVILALALGAFNGGDSQTQAGPAAAEAGGDPAEAGASGLKEGIQVHGDWVIEVRNADGSVAERREFENGLFVSGQELLANVLARQHFLGAWGVHLSGGIPNNPCTFNGQPGECLVHENIPPAFQNFGGSEKFPTLTVTTDPAPCCTGTTLVLQGNAVASRDGSIGFVYTEVCYTIPANVDPSICNVTKLVTGTQLQTPVNVVTGQQVLVTVRISFS